MTAALPLHLGALHTYETVLVALIAFGPFVVLALVVGVIRRRDIAEEAEQARSEAPAGSPAAPGDPEG